MAVPTITSVTPTFGPTGGVNQVEIIGTNFNVPAPAPPGPAGPALAFVNTVSVDFGGERSTLVMVITDTRLVVHPPPTPIPGYKASNWGAGKVDVKVTNLDSVTGDAISGEVAIATDAYEYRRPQLSEKSELLRLVEEVVILFKRQVITNVSITTHTDYDADTGDMLNITGLAEFPGIAITGPDLVENRFYSVNTRETIPGTNPDEFKLVREPYTVDVGFSLVGISESKIELINMMNAVQVLFRRNQSIYLLRDPDDTSKGYFEYEFDRGDNGDMKTIGTPNTSNIRAFAGNFLVRGFDIEGLVDFTDDFVSHAGALTSAEGAVLQQIEKLGEDFAIGPSPGESVPC